MSDRSIVPAVIEKVEMEFLRITLRVNPQDRESFLKDPRLFARQAIEAGGLKVNDLCVADCQVEEARKAVQGGPVGEPVTLVKVDSPHHFAGVNQITNRRNKL